MIVRELEKQERKYALDIIWSVFCMDVAEVYDSANQFAFSTSAKNSVLL